MATKIIDSIKEKYCDTNTFHESQWSLKEIITPDLVRKQYLPTSRKRKRAAVELSSYSYHDLFIAQSAEKAIKRIVIEGEAGFGKTTLCISITRDWAAGKLFQKFELLLMLPIHEKKLASVASIDALFSLVYDANTCAFIIDYLERHGEKVLIIVDGWDAMPSAPEQRKKCDLYNILFGDRFPAISVLVTSRPSTALRTLPCIDQFIELCGFNKETIEWCIQSYFPNKKEVAKNLLEQFDSNPLIENVCSIPLNCAIICDMMDSCDEPDEDLALPNTMTEMYNNLILHIINSSIEKSDTCMTVSYFSDIPDDLKLAWQSLCEIAFQAIFPIRGEFQVDSMNLSSFDVDKIVKFGIVKFVSEDEGKVVFHFCHQAIKAYLAVLHLVQQPQEAQIRIIRSYANLRQLTTVWRYFFGVYFKEIMTIDFDFIKQCIQILASKHNIISSDDGYTFCHYSFETKSKTVNDEVIKVFTTTKRQSPANLPLIHFGNPRTAHDCAAILNFIANIEQETCIELNFSDCLRDRQLLELVHLLDSKQSVVQLRTLDLSNNQFTGEMVVDLFVKLGSTVKFIEKLILRNCCIGEDGMDTIMAIITLQSQTLKFLDFSHNSVSLCNLSDVILTGALSNLEVLFLQGSVVEQENIPCLSEFFNALLSGCKYLRRLDLSANNFGDPGDPALSSIISQMTSICANFDLVLDRQYMSEVEKNFIEIMEESIRKKGTIDHTVAHGVIVGPGRSGKNSLMNRLLGKGPPPPGFQSSSTGVLECVRKIEVKKLCTAVSGFGLQWNELKYDEEAVELMTTTARSYNTKLELLEEGGGQRQAGSSDENAVSFIHERQNTRLSKGTSQASVVAPKRLKLVKNVKDSNIKDKRRKQKRENLFVYSSNVSSTDIFKQALQLRRMDGLREQLESSWSLYLTNTGGQIEFQELLPLLVSGPSVFFITFPLNRKLTDHYTVQYQYKDGSIQTYPSPSTLLDEILQTLATISTLNSEHSNSQPAKSSEHNVNLRPKIFFVGTHKDLVPKLSREKIIEEIDSTLQNCIRKTSLFDQGSIEYACPTKRLIFTVDNFAEDDDDFQKIRLALEVTVERCKDFTIRCPSTWLVFSLILRAKDKFNQVLTYNECFKIAQSCGISDRTELNNALFFIHTRLGLLRYFSVDGLNSLVILDPQVLFDRITDLIVSTYTKEHAEANEIHEFQSKGILSIATIQRLSEKSTSKSQIPLDWLLKLLNSLRIAAYFKDHTGDKYFFPSVICHAPEHQSESPILRDHPPVLVGFKTGFCPRGISGALIKYLMTNEMNSQLTWELHFSRIYKNQVTFAIKTLGDIILKIHPTHLQLQFDPQSDPSDLRLTCSEAFTQIKQGMKAIMNERDYFFAFYCTRQECIGSPHPAKIEWYRNNPSKLKCHYTDRRGSLPENYHVWMKPVEQPKNVYRVIQSRHIGEIADNMWEWEGRIADKLGLTQPDVAEIKMKYDGELNLQIRAALHKWKQNNGSMATYDSLIGVFQQAGNREYAEIVKRIRDEGMTIQQSDEVMDDSIPLSPPLPPQPSTYPQLQSPQFPSTPPPVELFTLINGAGNSSKSGILLDCDRVHYLPMPSPSGTSLSLEHNKSMDQEIEFNLSNKEEELNLKATSEEEPSYPCDQQEDVHYEIYDHNSDQFVYECCECHMDIKSRYHCRECDNFNLCSPCYLSIGHEHPMDKLGLDHDDKALQKPKNPREQRKASIEKCIQYLMHATRCHNSDCELTSCIKMKRVLTHSRECSLMLSNKWSLCKICKQFVLVCISHAKNCSKDKCPVPVCARIKKNLRDHKRQLQSQDQNDKNDGIASPATSTATLQQRRKDPKIPGYPTGPVQSPVIGPRGNLRPSYPQPIPPIVSQSTKPWHNEVNPDHRQHLVKKILEVTYPVHDPVALQDTRVHSSIQYAMKVEKVCFEVADDREEYYKLLARKIYQIQEELEDLKNQRKPSASNATSGGDPGPGGSSLGHTLSSSSAEGTLTSATREEVTVGGATQSSPDGDTPTTEGSTIIGGYPTGPVHSPVIGPRGNSRTSYPQPIPPIVSQPTQPWHDQVKPDLRQYLVKRLVEAIYPVPDPLAFQDGRVQSLIQYAMKVEKVMFEAADGREHYYKLLAQKIYHIRKELEDRKNKKNLSASNATSGGDPGPGGSSSGHILSSSSAEGTLPSATGEGVTIGGAAQFSSEGDTPTTEGSAIIGASQHEQAKNRTAEQGQS